MAKMLILGIGLGIFFIIMLIYGIRLFLLEDYDI